MNFLTRSLAIVLSASFGLAASASATTLDFDNGVQTLYAPFAPFMTNGDGLVQGGFYIGTASTKTTAQVGDLVGLLVDGTDNAACFNLNCPNNDKTNYLAMVDDGLPYLETLSGAQFRISSFDAGFIAASGATVPSVPLLLRVYGFIGSALYSEDVLLSGLSSGTLQFKTYTLSSTFASRSYDEIDFYGYACDATGSCNRSTNAAQFALDNINVTAVPEPATVGLMSLGLLALGAVRRRSARA